KIFERVMANQLITFLENNNLLDNEQFGFRTGKSVLNACIEFIDSVVSSIDEGKKSVGIFMDLSKAFDSVSHSKLLVVLQKLGIKNRALSWFKSYLANRKQFVEITYLNKFNQLINQNSKLRDVKFGVPQGSVLGPVLFLCYLKGLPGIANFNKITLYADDINLMISGKTCGDIEALAFDQLSAVEHFLNNKCLLLNPTKTKFITFSTIHRKPCDQLNIFLNEHLLEEVDETKFLGLTIDHNLNWNTHVLHITKKIASGIFVLRKMSGFCSLQTMKNIYY
ncbi:MAG: reverse transcriptase family protein, partial [Candidatus Phytoplasma stylosanthis]|nr:reverse transcriptase family protein [Candidatus Phytoplasma stylosanthis]